MGISISSSLIWILWDNSKIDTRRQYMEQTDTETEHSNTWGHQYPPPSSEYCDRINRLTRLDNTRNRQKIWHSKTLNIQIFGDLTIFLFLLIRILREHKQIDTGRLHTDQTENNIKILGDLNAFPFLLIWTLQWQIERANILAWHAIEVQWDMVTRQKPIRTKPHWTKPHS